MNCNVFGIYLFLISHCKKNKDFAFNFIEYSYRNQQAELDFKDKK